MRLLDDDADRKLDRVTLFLTLDEPNGLKDSLEGLIQRPNGNHAHVSTRDFRKEITVSVYDENQLDGLSERSKRLIREEL